MLDNKQIAAKFDGLFSDLGSESADFDEDTLIDQNDAMYDLLEFTDNQKQQAKNQLSNEDRRLGGLDKEDTSDMAEVNNPEDEGLSMKEKAEKEALEFMKQANASTEGSSDDSANIEANDGDANPEEERLNGMLDDIFAENAANIDDEDKGASSTSDTSDMSSVDSVAEAGANNFEAAAGNEAPLEVEPMPAMPDMSAYINEQESVNSGDTSEDDMLPDVDLDSNNNTNNDALDQMNSILDQAGNAPQNMNMSAPEAYNEIDDRYTADINMGSNVELQDYDNIDISDELLKEIDITEDLTQKLDEEDSLAEEQTLTKKELKAKLKAEAKAKKKAEKEAKKLAKTADKVRNEGGDPYAVMGVDDLFENGDVVDNMSKIAEKGVEGAAEEAAADVDMELFMSTGEAKESQPPMTFKQKMSLLFFGPDDEEEESEEEIAAKKAAKEAKAAAKEKAKEEKDAEKAKNAEAKALKKTKAREMAVVKKAAAKDKKAKIAAEEEAEDAAEKRIKPKQVITTFVILIVLAVTVVLGTNQFSYHMVIARATNYFEMQKYRKAYEQVVGVDVKDRDQEIKDKIYCVMYVQQQIDSYNNFCKLEMYENALDSLVKGIEKYNEHYEEAKALGIESDLDGLYEEITKDLNDTFGMNVDTVNAWIELDQETYSKILREFVASKSFSASDTSSDDEESDDE